MGIAAVLQAGAWGLFLGNGGLQLLPGLTTGLVTVASLGFPVAIGVYARHYVCELSLVRRPQMPESLEVCTHTFGGGYFVDEFPRDNVEAGESVKAFQRFRIRNAVEIGGYYIVDTARGEIPAESRQPFDALFHLPGTNSNVKR